MNSAKILPGFAIDAGLTGQRRPRQRAHRPLVRGSEETANPAGLVAKRVLDLTCLILGFPVILLVMLLVALVIKLVSPGPVFFRQERIGYGRRRFICLKFRTMKAGADGEVHRR